MLVGCALLQDGEDGGGQAGGAAAGGGVNLANADAERTLLRIKQKLEGVEAGGWVGLAGGGGRVRDGEALLCWLGRGCLVLTGFATICLLPLLRCRRGRGTGRGGAGAAADG